MPPIGSGVSYSPGQKFTRCTLVTLITGQGEEKAAHGGAHGAGIHIEGACKVVFKGFFILLDLSGVYKCYEGSYECPGCEYMPKPKNSPRLNAF